MGNAFSFFLINYLLNTRCLVAVGDVPLSMKLSQFRMFIVNNFIILILNKTIGRQLCFIYYYLLFGQLFMKYDEGESIEMAGMVIKASNTGLTQHQRFLVLREGFLYYYSQPPKNYKQGTQFRSSVVQTMPKHSISVAHINMIKGDFKSPSEFVVQFQHKHLMGETDIRESINNSNFNFQPKNLNDKEIVSWKFKVNNKETRDKWIAMIKSAREKQIKEKIMIETIFNSYGNDNKNEDFRKSFIPWKQSYQDEKKQALDFKKINKEEQKKKEEERIKKEQKEKEEKKLREEKDKERERKQMMEKLKEEARISLEKQMQEQAIRKQQEQQRAERERQQIERMERQKQERERQQREQQERIAQQQRLRQQEQRSQQQIREDSQKWIGQAPKYQSQLYKSHKLSQQDEQEAFRKQQQQIAIRQYELKQLEEQDRQKLAQYFKQSPSVSKPINSSINHFIGEPAQHEQSFVTSLKLSNAKELNTSPTQRNSTLLSRIRTEPNLQNKLHSSQIKSISHRISLEKSQVNLNQKISQYYELFLGIHYGSFQERLATQTKLASCISFFRDIATHTLKEMVDDQSQDFSKSSTHQSQGIIFTVASCQLQQSSNKKGVIQYFYDESKIKQTKRIFKSYQETVGKILKYSRQNSISLVIPLVVLIEYKGVIALAIQNNNENETAISRIELQNLSEALKSLSIDPNKVHIRQHKQQKCYIIYVKQPFQLSRVKSQTLAFDFPLDSQFLLKARLQNCSISLAHLQKYRQLLINTKLTPQTKDILEALSYCIYLKYVRKIYRSSHGELNENSFWNLFFKKDKELMKLITSIGCQYIPVYKGVMLSYLKYYFGIDIQFEDVSNMFSGEFPVRNVISHPKTKMVKLEGIQLEETLALFDTHISKNKFELAKEIVYLMETIYSSSLDKQQLFNTIYKKALVLNLECSYLPSAQVLESLIPQLPSYSTFKLKLFFLLIKNYSEIQNDKIFVLFKDTIDQVSINYGENHYQLITLNCIMAHYCAYKKRDVQNGRKFYQLALMLVQNYYDAGSAQIVQVLVDIGRMYANVNNLLEATKYLELVNKMMKEMSEVQDTKRVKLSIAVATILMQLGKTAEALQKLKQVETICDNAQLYQLFTLQFHLFSRSNAHQQIASLINKLFILSTNSKTLRSTFSMTFSFISTLLTKNQQQTLILITDKMFVDGDSNHMELIREKISNAGFGQYVLRIVKGLCSTNPEEESYQQLLNRYENVVGILGKQQIVALIEAKIDSSRTN